jgi:hypothetical protein
MRLTARQLNRTTLLRQLLLRREALGTHDGVRRIVAIQAQEPASPYLALWNRLAGFDAAELDAAFADGSVVKAPLLRVTLDAVAADDYPTFHTAMQSSPRTSRLADGRLADSDLDPDQMATLQDHLVGALTRPHTAAEIEALLAAHHGVPVPRAWWALRTYAPLRRAPTGGPWSFGSKQAFIAAPAAAAAQPASPESALAWLVRRCLEGFGPASLADVAQFTRLARSVIRAAIEALGDDVELHEGPDGATLYDVPGGAIAADAEPAPPRLLPMWDSVLMAYADRSRVIPEAYRRTIIRANGDVLPTLLVDGLVAGVWRPVPGGIEATAFHPLSVDAWPGLVDEARALIAFLADRDPVVYRRYARWWTTLEGAEVRVLPAR